MAYDANTAVELAASGSTGTGRKSAAGFKGADRILVEVEVEAIGSTPTMTFTIQTSVDGTNWSDTGYVTLDSTVAAAKTAIVVTTVGVTQRFIDGLATRSPEYVAVNVTANTNVTYSARAYPVTD
jgi:hypothetical protein